MVGGWISGWVGRWVVLVGHISRDISLLLSIFAVLLPFSSSILVIVLRNWDERGCLLIKQVFRVQLAIKSGLGL